MVSKKALIESVTKLSGVLGQYTNVMSEIVIEGHASTSGGDKINIPLSKNRAKAVYDFCVKNIANFEAFANKGIDVKVVGKSSSELVYDDVEGEKVENALASQRVVIKFSLDKAKIAKIKSNDAELLKLKTKINKVFPSEAIDLQAK